MTTAFEAAHHIEQARLRGGIPGTDSRFTTDRMLSLLTAEMQGAIAPMVHAAKSDHGVVPYTLAATAGASRYSLPPSAFANTLRDVFWISADGRASPLHQISAADSRTYTLRNETASRPEYFVLQGSTVMLYPTPSTSGTLAMPYYARPAELVLASSVVRIPTVTAHTGNAYTFTFVGTPPAALQVASVVVDVVRGTPGFETVANGVTASVTQPSPGTWVYQLSCEETISVGDYICPAGQSPVPQIPVELFPLLHARVAYVAVPSTGDNSQAANALASQVEDLTRRAVDLLRPRVESASPTVGRGMGSNPMLRGLV